MSCKDLKALINENGDIVPIMKIIGGTTFNINTPDDEVHSDGSIIITGGTFNIYTWDDSVHAEGSVYFRISKWFK